MGGSSHYKDERGMVTEVRAILDGPAHGVQKLLNTEFIFSCWIGGEKLYYLFMLNA